MAAAAEAERRAAEERKKREQEWARFARALAAVVPTQRDGWTLSAAFPPNLEREKLSRLAGVLLAVQGYQAVLEDAGDPVRAERIKQYLIAAGAPPEVLHRAAGQGKLMRLRIADTILQEAAPPPPEPVLPAAPSSARAAAPSSARAAAPAKSASRPAAAAFQIQVASFRDGAEARRLAAALRADGHQVEIDAASRAGWVRVLVGPFAERAAAERAERRLRNGGHDTWLQRR